MKKNKKMNKNRREALAKIFSATAAAQSGVASALIRGMALSLVNTVLPGAYAQATQCTAGAGSRCVFFGFSGGLPLWYFPVPLTPNEPAVLNSNFFL